MIPHSSLPQSENSDNKHEQVTLFYPLSVKEVPLFDILTRNISSNFFLLSSFQYVSTKTACYRPFKNGHFCTEKRMDHQYRENSPRNIRSNYNWMRAYVECSPNQ